MCIYTHTHTYIYILNIFGELHGPRFCHKYFSLNKSFNSQKGLIVHFLFILHLKKLNRLSDIYKLTFKKIEIKSIQSISWKKCSYTPFILSLMKSLFPNLIIQEYSLNNVYFLTVYVIKGASLIAQLVKNLPAMRETWIQSLNCNIPWRREGLPTPVFWLEEFHGLYSPWGHKDSMGPDWETFTLCDKIDIVSYKIYFLDNQLNIF